MHALLLHAWNEILCTILWFSTERFFALSVNRAHPFVIVPFALPLKCGMANMLQQGYHAIWQMAIRKNKRESMLPCSAKSTLIAQEVLYSELWMPDETSYRNQSFPPRWATGNKFCAIILNHTIWYGPNLGPTGEVTERTSLWGESDFKILALFWSSNLSVCVLSLKLSVFSLTWSSFIPKSFCPLGLSVSPFLLMGKILIPFPPMSFHLLVLCKLSNPTHISVGFD